MINKNTSKKHLTPALTFILFMGMVSLFSDMTHEGARSIYGVYLSLAGASAATIGFVTGFGEFVGYTFRLITGIFTDKRKNYWPMAIFGYSINMAAIPALMLIPENGWFYACILIVLERMGKAIRYPAKNTLVSFAAAETGQGKGFAVVEFMDQLGAFFGPIIVFIVLFLSNGENHFSTYALCFGVLGIPALLTILTLLLAKKKFPQPENFDFTPDQLSKEGLKLTFILYIIAISMLALGFADFPLITMHVFKLNLIPANTLPLLYAVAMLSDAFSALIFGWLYDHFGIRILMISTAISALFSFFVFSINSLIAIIIGVIMWGVGMGAQESILMSAVGTIVPKENRSTGFGLFQAIFGVFWFLGSWLMGIFYDITPVLLVVFSVATQLLAIPIFYFTWKTIKNHHQKN